MPQEISKQAEDRPFSVSPEHAATNHYHELQHQQDNRQQYQGTGVVNPQRTFQRAASDSTRLPIIATETGYQTSASHSTL